MGYYSDFQGQIRAVFVDADSAMTALDGLRRLAVYDRSGFAPMFDYERDGAAIVASCDRYEKWYDADVDAKRLVGWLHDHGATTTDGDVLVSGEDPYDMWRLHVDGRTVRRQTGRVVYEDDEGGAP